MELSRLSADPPPSQACIQSLENTQGCLMMGFYKHCLLWTLHCRPLSWCLTPHSNWAFNIGASLLYFSIIPQEIIWCLSLDCSCDVWHISVSNVSTETGISFRNFTERIWRDRSSSGSSGGLTPLQIFLFVCLLLWKFLRTCLFEDPHPLQEFMDPPPWEGTHCYVYPLLIEKRRGLSPGGRFPPSFIHLVIIITGLNKLYNCMFSPWRWP